MDTDQGEWVAPGTDNFKVVVRVRPPLPRELRGNGLRPYQCTTLVEAEHILTLSENLQVLQQGTGGTSDPSLMYGTYRFTFDHVYDQEASQEEVYACSAQHVVLSILQGYNAAIIAYGQTGTGKTFTMEGELQGPSRGIIPRTVEDIFTHIVNDPEPSSKYLVRASYLQIYNEVISDLLKPDRTNLAIREDRRRGVYVDGLSEWVVRSPQEVYQLMEMGQSMRATGATKLNEVSSRSHAVCIIIVEKCTTTGEDAAAMGGGTAWPRSSVSAPSTASHSIKVGKLNLVDLAGSERVHVTGAVGKRLEESKKINASLSALGNVIAALTDRRGERQHVPYRDSKLTRILEDSLGGNCRTTMVCTIAPAGDAFQETLSTLKFANRAKSIKNEAHVNEDLDQRTLLRRYERELKRLRAELQERSRSLVDKRALLEAEEQTRRAEADRLAVLTALERRSRELMREKEEKLALERKIADMQSQFVMGGVALPGSGPRGGSLGARGNTHQHGLAGAGGGGAGGEAGAAGDPSLEDAPAFKQLLKREQQRIRGEYEARLRELESERQAVEEDRQQVDRYKQLLLKQRDIMIALTARLNERDEQIMALQEELEGVERVARHAEDQLDGRTAELYALRKAAMEASTSPDGLTNLLAMLGRTGGRTAPSSSSHLGGQSPGAVEVEQLVGQSSGALPSRTASSTLSRPGTPGGAGGLVQGSAASAALLAEQADRIRRLQMDKEELVAQLGAHGSGGWAQSAGRHPTMVSQDGWSEGPPQQHQEVVGLEMRVESLTAACEAAQRERSALQTILDTKVRRMLTDMMADVGQDAQSMNGNGQRLTARLRGLELVLDKVAAALRAAPPILPPEERVAQAQGGDSRTASAAGMYDL